MVIYNAHNTMPKHGKYDYTHIYIYNLKYHSWLHDYVVHMEMFIH